MDELNLGFGLGPGARAAAQELSQSIGVKVDADTGPFNEAVANAMDALDAWANTTHATNLDADITLLLRSAAIAGAAAAWEESTFTADFAIDLAQMWSAADEAWRIGGAWDTTTFTASFAVDTSGLTAARAEALATAQYIRDIMPNSPAKRGPLSGKTPSLDYIADAFRSSFDRIRSDANAGMAALAGAITSTVTPGRFGVMSALAAMPANAYPAGGGGTQVVNVFALRPDEWVKYAQMAERGNGAAQTLSDLPKAYQTN